MLEVCPGKIGHDSKAAAQKAAKRLGHAAYFCEQCRAWHTRNVKGKKQRRYVRRRRSTVKRRRP